ncbi:MAG: hypothetical protein LBJ71_00175, partial [Holosporaceae bacterium]|nr:hypothetical protein [Holosporaceae bacterium]
MEKPNEEQIENNENTGSVKSVSLRLLISTAIFVLFIFLCCGVIDISDEEILDLYLNNIEQVSKHKMS